MKRVLVLELVGVIFELGGEGSFFELGGERSFFELGGERSFFELGGEGSFFELGGENRPVAAPGIRSGARLVPRPCFIPSL